MRKLVIFLVMALLMALLPATTHAVDGELFTFDSLDYAACTPGEYARVSFTYIVPDDILRLLSLLDADQSAHRQLH